VDYRLYKNQIKDFKRFLIIFYKTFKDFFKGFIFVPHTQTSTLMKKIVFLVFLLSITFYEQLYCQNNLSYTLEDVLKQPVSTRNFNYGGFEKITGSAKGVEGSPYLLETWTNTGKIQKNNGTIVENATLNYNTYTGEMEIKFNDESKALNVLLIKKVWLADREFIITQYNGSNTFLEKVYEGKKYLLLKKWEMEITKADYNIGTNTGKQYDQIAPKSITIVKFPNGEYKPFEYNKKSFLSIFKADEVKINNFVKKSKYSYKQEKDIIKIIEFIDNEK
jgi:hypothetical protein